MQVTNFFYLAMESGELRLLGGLCFFINKSSVQFNVPFSGLCCK